MKTITADQLHDLQSKDGTILVDVRTPEQYNLAHIKGAVNIPLDTVSQNIETLKSYQQVICYCNSGNTSSQFCKQAMAAGIDHVVNLTGGINGCKSCTIIRKKGVLPIMQQVQVAAGSLVLLGILLMLGVHPYFLGLSAFVGAGLVFAGASGWCGMAKLLAMLPRNNTAPSQAQSIVTGDDVMIKQFADTNLSHYSYMISSQGSAYVVDPTRDPQQYYDYATTNKLTIIGVLNTHPHADFASGHLQIHQDTGATIYVSKDVGASYPHTALVGGEVLECGNASIVTYLTPGHSPDSISYLVRDHHSKDIGLLTGDWVFLGDVGRADLRESVGNVQAKQQELAGMMYDTTRTILPALDGSVMILPAHGAGTSCGKGLSSKNIDTLENQRRTNPMLQPMTREAFITELTQDQPAIPAYFPNSVLLNKQGNRSVTQAVQSIDQLTHIPQDGETIIIDARSHKQIMMYPLSDRALTIDQSNSGFISMVGTLIKPDQSFVVIVEKLTERDNVIKAVLSIGYDAQCTGIYSVEANAHIHTQATPQMIDQDASLRVLDVRSHQAFLDNPIYPHAINIPVDSLLETVTTLDPNLTYIPYCGGTFKSALASSILRNHGYHTTTMKG